MEYSIFARMETALSWRMLQEHLSIYWKYRNGHDTVFHIPGGCFPMVEVKFLLFILYFHFGKHSFVGNVQWSPMELHSHMQWPATSCPPTLCRIHDKSCIYDVFTTTMRSRALAGQYSCWCVMCCSPVCPPPPHMFISPCPGRLAVLLCWQLGQQQPHIAAYPRAG